VPVRKGPRLIWVAVFALAATASAGDIHLGTSVTSSDIHAMTAVLSDALELPTLAPAEPLGLTGFELLLAAGGPQVDTDAHWWRSGVTGNTVGGTLVAPRVLVRKGLPFRLDVGAQGGSLLGYRFWGGELRWAAMEGGSLSPALGVRVAYARLTGAPLRLSSVQAQVEVSKGFAFLTPYAALGFRDARGTAAAGGEGGSVHASDSRVTGVAGVRVSLLPFQLVGEVRQGRRRGYFVGLGVGI
jgi:hypothetical protein